MKLILASQSPRRKELLENEGYLFEIHPAIDEEVFDSSLSIDEALEKVAVHKAREVADLYTECLTLAADTIVVDDQKILGKPVDEKEAISTLRSLSGRTHFVKTGVCFIHENKTYSFVDTTEVHFRNLSDLEILTYVKSGRCMDKAGSYGIQECDFVEWIDGSYSNVMGLPMEKVIPFLQRFQILKI